MNKSIPSTKEKSMLSSRKPHKVQISHRAVMRAQTSFRSAKQTPRTHRTTPSRNDPTPPPIPSYLSKNSKKEPLKPMKTQSLLNNQELIDLRESLYKDLDFSNIKTQQLNALSGHLREFSQFCGLQRRYPEAKQATQLFKAVSSEISQRAVVSVDLSKEVNSFESKKEEELDRLTLEIIEFDEETDQKRYRLKYKQQQEYEEFQKQWKKVMPDRYRKVSPQLLSLMTREKKCARCGEFDKAEILKKEVDERVNIEKEIAQSQLNSDYNEAKTKFLENQSKEMESFEKVRSHWREVMVARHKEELAPFANRQCVIDIRKSKTSKIDSSIAHPTTAGCVSKIINEIGLDYEALLPPLMEPSDEKIIDKNKKEKVQRIDQQKNLKKRINVKDQKIKQNQDPVIRSNSIQKIKNSQDSIFQTQDALGKFIESDSYSSDLDDFNQKCSEEISKRKISFDNIQKYSIEKTSNKTNENTEPNEKDDSVIPNDSFQLAQQISHKLVSNQTQTNSNLDQIIIENDPFNCSDNEDRKINQENI